LLLKESVYLNTEKINFAHCSETVWNFVCFMAEKLEWGASKLSVDETAVGVEM
jgi:hypothetical protein